jgi:tRNA nucleotidyltransferase/poly(A) polymerase
VKIYRVGGSVRDYLMGIKSSDLDYVVVGSSPEEMISLGYTQVGADFPVFLHPETKSEYALARTERKTGNGYHGFTVSFSRDVTLEEDLSRRDFTAGSMAMDDEGNIIDPFGGVQDIKDRVLRHTSAAFVEDPLRVIRLARFAARFNFDIAESTNILSRQIVESGEMEHLPAERIWAEMEKTCKQGGDLVTFFKVLIQVGAIDRVKFFTDVFGQDSFKNWISKCINSSRDLRKIVALIATSDAVQESAVIPLEVKRLTKAIRKLRSLNNTAADIIEFFNFIRAFSDPEFYRTVSQTIFAGECSGEKYAVSSIRLDVSRIIAARITAEPYMHLKGKEIGAAMNLERINLLRELYDYEG